jgi:dihydroorotate dehydrogenase (fumarate)
MHSLFEEQICLSDMVLRISRRRRPRRIRTPSHFPASDEFALGPSRYLEQLHRIKKRAIPVIGSLNGATTKAGSRHRGRFSRPARTRSRSISQHRDQSPDDANIVERSLFDIVAVVRESVTIPVAVKLSPFHSSIRHVASKLDSFGVAGLVLFNRFYQADIDPETREVVPRLEPRRPQICRVPGGGWGSRRRSSCIAGRHRRRA